VERTDARATGSRPVVVVTGGGGGIGAAVAEELGRTGWFVVTVDPLVSIDGAERLPTPTETTAARIVAAGGEARASSASVTDGEAIHDLFADLVDEFGRLDAVINVAGISRPTSFAAGSDEDWHGILSVHLDGYLNVLRAALPIMAAAGRGHILGVTSGSGWRQADAGAYGCAKRAVAALTWQLGRAVPQGVTVNAMSPIAVTRMVTAALGRARLGSAGASAGASAGPGSSPAATGGLSLGSMPTPEQLGPMGAYLVSDAFDWCSGEVIFVGGPEVAVIEPPRLLEVVRTDDVVSLASVLDAVTGPALAAAEANQATGGGSNPRFGPIFDEPGVRELVPPAVGSCAIVTDRPEEEAALVAALDARGVTCHIVDASAVPAGFGGPAAALDAIAEGSGALDGVVIALAGPVVDTDVPEGWERLLAEHVGVVDRIHVDAAWARAAADHSASTDRPIRLVTLTDACTAGGRSRAQASAQLARSARRATGDRVTAFAVSVEGSGHGAEPPIGEIAAHLLCSADSPALSGAELVAGSGWFGLRSHPRPSASTTFGGPAVPGWLGGTLRSIVDPRGLG
jgi:NAD(P)-dependent dehydrogenase (short-subunit alcohol dehydrogenase family)